MKKILIIIFLILINIANAQTLEVVKEANKQLILGENLNVKIKFNNPYNSSRLFSVTEILPQNVNLIKPEKADVEFHNGIKINSYKWQVNVNPNTAAVIDYVIQPGNLGYYSIQPTMVLDKTNNNAYKSSSIDFIVTCKSNNVCEDNENYLNCPQDCKKSIKDNICDPKADNICDPDCEEDPDCKIEDKSKNSIILYGVILLIIIFIIIFIRKIKKIKQ